MRISLHEHGGIAAAIQLGRPAKVLDSATLEPAAAAELSRLLAAARAAPILPATPRPDAMSYTITVENADGPVTLHGSDAAMTPEFEALLNWVQERLS